MKIFQTTARIVLLCAIVMLAAGCGQKNLTEQQIAELQTQIEKGDKSALKSLISNAQDGDKLAQYALGRVYDFGQGAPQDYAQAAQWYRKAAEQNHPDAQYSLGLMYELGQGTQQNYGQAARWYRKAAEQGQPYAQYGMGMLYALGQGIPKDYEQADQWFRKSAAQGNTDALRELGFLYRYGQGVPRNKVAAHALCSLSAALDSSADNEALSCRAKLAEDLTTQEIEDSQKLVIQIRSADWSLQALDQYLTA
ncbi:MAG: sel1 repeat family protein, partial [Methylobacillus sp.]|nr:sel1 repeat family protein [Methylobacillus sp.]